MVMQSSYFSLGNLLLSFRRLLRKALCSILVVRFLTQNCFRITGRLFVNIIHWPVVLWNSSVAATRTTFLSFYSLVAQRCEYICLEYQMRRLAINTGIYYVLQHLGSQVSNCRAVAVCYLSALTGRSPIAHHNFDDKPCVS